MIDVRVPLLSLSFSLSISPFISLSPFISIVHPYSKIFYRAFSFHSDDTHKCFSYILNYKLLKFLKKFTHLDKNVSSTLNDIHICIRKVDQQS